MLQIREGKTCIRPDGQEAQLGGQVKVGLQKANFPAGELGKQRKEYR